MSDQPRPGSGGRGRLKAGSVDATSQDYAFWLGALAGLVARIEDSETVEIGARNGVARLEVDGTAEALLEAARRSLAGPAGPDAQATHIHFGTERAGAGDIVFMALPEGDGVRLVAEYDRERFEEGTVRGFLDGWAALARGLSAHPGESVRSLPLLDPETAKAAAKAQTKTKSIAADGSVVAWVEAAVDRAPDRVAVIVPGALRDETYTYADLEARANRIAHLLRSIELGPEALIGVYLDRSFDLVAAILGAMKSGGAYLPIDLSYPPERVAFMLEDAAAPWIITTSALAKTLPKTSAKVLCLDADADLVDAQPITRPKLTIGPERLAYVIYTSGSTGQPKGVMVTHANVLRLFRATEPWFGFGPTDAWTLFHSHAFDFSVWEIFGALGYGGRLIVVPYLVSRGPEAFLDLLVRQRVTVLNQTPSAFRQLIRAEGALPEPAALALRYVIFGGEALELSALSPWFDRHGDASPRLVNMYGITETTVHVTYRPITALDVKAGLGSVIGGPIPDLGLLVLDAGRNPVPVGVPGELYVSGAGLARGYLRREELTRARFVTHDFGDGPIRLYRTGDRARRTRQGELEYLGRVDHQVKLRGFRIELGEIEAQILKTGNVAETVVMVRDDDGHPKLVAYVVAKRPPVDVRSLRAALEPVMPSYMLPSAFVALERLPLTQNGKVDRRALPAPAGERPELAASYVAPQSTLEATLAGLYKEALGLDRVGLDDNFFDLGGDSLLLTTLRDRVQAEVGAEIPLLAFFEHPTIAAMARHLGDHQQKDVLGGIDAWAAKVKRGHSGGRERTDIAVIGMAGRFPGADDVDEFWSNLRHGKDTIAHFTQEQLEKTELDYERVKDDPSYVPARGIVKDADCFDAAFFGYNPREAALIDPQHRVWLEEAYHALEDAGIDPSRFAGNIGVFAGSFTNNYLLYNLARDRAYVERYVRGRSADALSVLISNDKDFVANRTSYKLDLRGPAFAIGCGCSTSLVAVIKGCQSLLAYESDVALAGGVCISVPQTRGYLYSEGTMVSIDGTVRSFDADAKGTVFSNGAGVVVLKRLEDAMADGDRIMCVVRGGALNNDGGHKVSYTAPTVDGQAEVIARAQAVAEVGPETIQYVEGHGTATPLGDPIEVAALTKAFRHHTKKRQFCGLGSVKSNIGHLEQAAGVAGFMKTALALYHAEMPPTVHYRRANPEIDFGNSPFFVVDKLTPWPKSDTPRRAGVSAFGVGGTNAHVILEEAPARAASGPARDRQLLLLSAHTPEALAIQSDRLRALLEADPTLSLADVAHTLRVGRKALAHRQLLVVGDRADAIAALAKKDPRRIVAGRVPEGAPSVVFMFPGQGAQHVDMGRALYDREPVFKREVDGLSESLRPHLGLDLRTIIYPASGDVERAAETLKQTGNTQPALFVVEYALAKLWMSLGVQPDVMVGHSVGEYVAACLAGVFAVEDAAKVLAIRAQLMQSRPSGSMRAVRMNEAELQPYLIDGVSLAAVNAPGLAVVSGPTAAISAFDRAFAAKGLETIELHTSHAFHSSMMDPILKPFADAVKSVPRRAPTLPFVSTSTGRFITDAEATDPEYWANQLRRPVRFSAAIQKLLETPRRVFLEVGPSQNLSTSVRQHKSSTGELSVVATLGTPKDLSPASEALLGAIGRLWIAGVTADWQALVAGESRLKVRLPGYPFARVRHWVEPPALAGASLAEAEPEIALETDAPPVEVPAEGDTRRDRIQGKLKGLLFELSGIEIKDEGVHTSFTEIGFDSLFLTQASTEIQNQLGVKVKFRRLLEDVTTLSALTDLLESELPKESFAAAPARPKATSKPASKALDVLGIGAPIAQPGDSPMVEQVIRAQLRLMAEQLEVLRGEVAPKVVNGGSQAMATVSKDYGKTKAGRRPFTPYRAIEKGKSGGLTPPQQAHLDRLIERLASKTRSSKRMAAAHRAFHADPRGVSGFKALWKEIVYQLVMVRSLGPRMWDVDGNEYVDITGGFGINFLGHSPPFVRAAVEAQLVHGFEVSPQSPLAGEVAEMFCRMTGNERAFFVNTGSEAVQAALRLARTVTGRSRIAYFAESYHGVFDEVLARPQITDGQLYTVPAAPGVPQFAVNDAMLLDYGSPESLEIIKRAGKDLAAVLVETVQSRHPENQPREFLKELRAITEQNGTALILDEVITGFRYHQAGLQGAWGIRADLATYGKVVGGGMPIGVVGGRAKFLDAVDGGAWQYGDDSVPEADVTYFAGTFHRHPLALAAAKAVLQFLEAQGPGLQAELNRKTSEFAAAMNRSFEAASVPIRMPHFSSWFRFDFPNDLVYMPMVAFHLLDKGIYARQIGQNNFLSITHSDADIDLVKKAIVESVAELQSVGLLPGASPTVVAVPAEIALPEGAFPLTEAQREIWLTSQMGDAASCAFNESFTLELDGPLEEAALRGALEDVLGRHRALHFRFARDGSNQTIHQQPLGLSIHDRSKDPAEAWLEELRRSEATTPFSLEQGPLFRFHLVKLGANRHQLIFTVHHIVLDGWSAAVLIDELAALYTARVESRPAVLPPALPFTDYVAWEKATEVAAEGRESLEYWKARFKTEPPAVQLPTDRPRQALKAFDGGSLQHSIAKDTLEAAKRAAKAQGVTLFAFLLAGFETLIHRLTGQTDLLVGIPVAGQAVAGMHQMIGHAVNFLPVRVELDGEAAVSDLIKRSRTALLDAQDHQHATFGRIVQHVRLSRERSRLPFIQVVFNLDRPLMTEGFKGLKAEVRDNIKRHVQFELFLNLSEESDGLGVKLDYDTALFDHSTVARWIGIYETILRGISEAPEQPVWGVPLLSEAEKKKILYEWNDTAATVPSGTVHEIIFARAERYPDKIAVHGDGGPLSYRALGLAAKKIAGHLQANGAGPGSKVGVCTRRSPEGVAALLGVLEAGAAYVPLDPDFPSDRLAFIAEDAGLAAILTEGSLLKVTDPLVPKKLRLEEALLASEAPIVPGRADDLAYMIYTSGSTGKPKGVKIPHRAVVSFLTTMAERPGLVADDRLFAVTTFSFDIHVLEIFLPLFVGGSVHVAAAAELQSGATLSEALARSKANVMQATPSWWRVLLDSGWTAPPGFKGLCGGEALPRDLADTLAEQLELWNMFGPTETTVWSLCDRVSVDEGAVSIGRPIANTTVYVLDPRGQVVPVGVAGELSIGGAGVADGYHQRPELDAGRFVPDPYSRAPGARLYKTGDSARFRPDGRLDFLGRLDFQVKVRGHRIELGEIDTILGQHPGVGPRATVVREDRPGDKRLVAYYVPAKGSVVTGTELREHLRKKLPDYMVPQHFVELAALPQTPNGKIDQKALIRDFGIGADQPDTFIAPRTPTEIMLAELWQKTLAVEKVGVTDNFFELGGHSLLAMGVLLEVERKTGVRWTTQEMVFSSLEQLAKMLEGDQPSDPLAPSQPPPGGRPPASGERPSLRRKLFDSIKSRVLGS